MRSYVTIPTTMSAMPDIPAKTPRPIGRTRSFVPGSLKGGWELEGALSAALVPDGVREELVTALAEGLGFAPAAFAGLTVAPGDEADEAADVAGALVAATVLDGKEALDTIWCCASRETKEDYSGCGRGIFRAGMLTVERVLVTEDTEDEPLVVGEVTHVSSSCTAGCPSAPVTGVKVILHVCSMGPEELAANNTGHQVSAIREKTRARLTSG